MDEEKLLAWHRPRAKALLEAGCDLFACETVQEPQSQIWNRLAATGS
jgi:S-methylmethionine-dependent homocysteine/selenocysteine methylase